MNPKTFEIWKHKRRKEIIKYFDFLWRDMYLKKLSSLKDMSLHDLLGLLPEFHGKLPESKNLFYIAVDKNYLLCYANQLANSIDKNSPGSGVHFHLYNPDKSTFLALDGIQNKYSSIFISYTWEDASSISFSNNSGIYYQSARFIRLYQILCKIMGHKVIAIDADTLVRYPFEDIVKDAYGLDIGVIFRPKAVDSSRKILAAFLYVAATEPSLKFLEYASRCMALHLVSGLQTESLDQRCLWYSYKKFRDKISVWSVPLHFCDSNFGENSPIWHGKGNRKAEIQNYAKSLNR